MTLDDMIAGLRCRDVLLRLGDYVDGTLADAERAGVEAHVAGCANCAAFGGVYGAVATSLRRQLSAPAVEADVAARLAERLARER
jgi:anti-sigma factor RsiW